MCILEEFILMTLLGTVASSSQPRSLHVYHPRLLQLFQNIISIGRMKTKEQSGIFMLPFQISIHKKRQPMGNLIYIEATSTKPLNDYLVDVIDEALSLFNSALQEYGVSASRFTTTIKLKMALFDPSPSTLSVSTQFMSNSSRRLAQFVENNLNQSCFFAQGFSDQEALQRLQSHLQQIRNNLISVLSPS